MPTLVNQLSFVRGFQPPPLFLRRPPLDPDCPLLFKIFVFSPLWSILHPLKYFRQSPHPHKIPSCLNLTHQLSWHIISRFRKISKEWSYQFNYRFLSKIDFWFFISFYKYISLCQSMGYFRFIFRQLKDDFFS